MATGSDIITGAFRKLQIRTSETPIEPDEMADGLEELNDIGAEYGLFPPVQIAGDTIRIDRGMEGPLKTILASMLAPEYIDNIPIKLEEQIDSAWDSIWRIHNGSLNVQFPGTLPSGSGNHDSGIILEDTEFLVGARKVNF